MTNSAKEDYLFKVIILGDSSVGKSVFISKFIDDKFSFDSISTIGVMFKEKTVSYDGKTAKIQLWDTAGQERLRSITKQYFRGIHGAILMYDITCAQSYNNLAEWYRTIEENAGSVPIIIVGSKSDLVHARAVATNEARSFAEERQCSFLETSSLNGNNVNEVFTELIGQIFTNIASKTLTSTLESGSAPAGVVIDQRSPEDIVADTSPHNTVLTAREPIRTNTVNLTVGISVTRQKSSCGC